MKKNKSLFYSTFFSLSLHAGLFVLFQTHSLATSLSGKSPHRSSSWISSMEKRAKEEILKEAVQRMSQASEPVAKLEPILENIQKEVFSPPSFAETKENFSEKPVEPSPAEELFSQPPILTFTVPLQEENSFLESLSNDFLLPHPKLETPLEPKEKPVKIAVQTKLDLTPPYLQGAFSLSAKEGANFRESPFLIAPSLMAAQLKFNDPKWHRVPTLKELDTLSYSESFDIEVSFLKPSEEEEEYLFALTLIPKEEVDLPPIRQHYTFLIDRSNSILEKRLRAVKSAVYKAISTLDTEDTFNIFTFDSKVEKLSASSVKNSKKMRREVKQFLEKAQLGSFFSSGDLYKPLFLTVPSTVSEDEIFTVILITDGEQLSKKNMQHALLRDWTAYNQGKVSLFGLGLGNDPLLRSLEAAALFNRGKLIYSSTTRGIKRKLMKLMKMTEAPIAKNLSCTALSSTPQMPIELFTKASQSPHLYGKEPYTLLGKTKDLDDFILFVQGRIRGKWLNIKKKISFLNAKEASPSLKEEWALQKAFRAYETYLLENNPKYLVEAKETLAPFNLEVNFK